jgi:hypothetical protein
MPHAMRRAGIEWRNIPCGRTIRRMEATGRMPAVRLAFGIAQFFETDLHSLWPLEDRQAA